MSLLSAGRDGKNKSQLSLKKLVLKILLDLLLKRLIQEVVLFHMLVQFGKFLLSFFSQVVVDFLQDFLDGAGELHFVRVVCSTVGLTLTPYRAARAFIASRAEEEEGR